MPNATVTIGIISDTHIPFRWDDIPQSVFECFAGVDLIIHAGDVGEMWVLDKLRQIAPVVAVHGNDEGKQSPKLLPFQQVLLEAGQRIVITHGHFPNRNEELESRKDDSWYPKLSRWANFGKQNDAQIVIYGHTHIPMALHYDDVLLINPGAIASGSIKTRQIIQSVACLTVQPDQIPIVEHFNLNQHNKVFLPQVDVDAGFATSWANYQSPVIFPNLKHLVMELSRHIGN